jgi:PAS domain S-box-containing protein
MQHGRTFVKKHPEAIFIQINGDNELSELSELGESTTMADKLKKSHSSVENLHREVTERKRAGEAVWVSEVWLQGLAAIRHLGIWRLDLRGNRFSWTDGIYRLYGVTRENFEPTYDGLMKLIHPEDRGYFAQVTETIRRDGKCDFEYRVVRPDGELRYVMGNGEVVHDERGEAVAMIGTVLDTTELATKERKSSARDTELESFSHTISHDLRSPLVTVTTFLEYLEEDLSRADADRIRQDMSYIRAAAIRMRELVEELIQIARIGKITSSSVHTTFRQITEEVLSTVGGIIAKRRVEVRVGDDAIALYGDRVQLLAIWQNLLENSVKFMGDQASPCIELGAERCGGDMVFFVRDNGMGIDPRCQAQVFRLFNKLDPKSEGAGLGLARIKRIIEMYGGTIWLESEGLGHGVCFRFTLPGAVKGQNAGEES